MYGPKNIELDFTIISTETIHLIKNPQPEPHALYGELMFTM